MLFGEERRHLDELADTIDRVRELHSRQLEEMERRVSLLERSPDTVERHLAAAIHRRDDEENPGRDEFIRALTHPVEESVRRSLSQNPERLGGPVRGVVFGSLGAVGRDWARSLGLDRFAAGAARHRRPLRVAAWSAIALLTGWLAFSIVENLQLDRAAEHLRETPGYVVHRVENPLFAAPTLHGLRDPLAPAPGDVLLNLGASPGRLRFDFAPYASQGTVYAEKRDAERREQLEGLHRRFVEAIGSLANANETVRSHDLQIMTRALFQLQFPEVADRVEIALEDDRWVLRGELEEPLYSEFKERVPGLILTGELDVSRLENGTENRFRELRDEIESVTLVYLSATPELSEDGVRQSERLIRLIREYDENAAAMGRMPASFEIHALPVVGDSAQNRLLEKSRLEATERLLMKQAGLPVERLLPSVHDEIPQDGRVGIYVRVIEVTAGLDVKPEN